MNERFVKFGNSIDRLIAGKDLSREEAQLCFAEILKAEQSDIHQGAFLSAITAKGPSPKEIAGVWQAIYDFDTVKVSPKIKKPIVDNSGTGMDGFKTFNISTAAAIVAAAGGLCLARHGARAITSRCGTVDLCEALGIDMECPAQIVQTSIEQAGIGLFNGMSACVHPHALFRILSQMRFGSILNIAASLANPVKLDYGVRGVYSAEMITPVICSMKEIGFKRALVFHGQSGNGSGGMDEISPVAESLAAELSAEGNIAYYRLEPKDLGLRGALNLSEIAGGSDPNHEAVRLLKVFNGKDKKTLYETICLNTAPIFYVADEVRNLKEGVEKARDIIDSGDALDKLRMWVHMQNRDADVGEKRLDELMDRL
ncbi:MAG: anthranilate phosphoribosyltransferase [Desulfobacterales bacterium]|nr:anthranilate phosphoribosyltransferase [Desulfobacterales bacterium]